MNIRATNPSKALLQAIDEECVKADFYSDGEVWIDLCSYEVWIDQVRERYHIGIPSRLT